VEGIDDLTIFGQRIAIFCYVKLTKILYGQFSPQNKVQYFTILLGKFTWNSVSLHYVILEEMIPHFSQRI